MRFKSVIGTIRNIDELLAHEKNRQRLIQKCCDLLAETPIYRLAWILLVDKDKEFTAFAVAGIDRHIVADLVKEFARGGYLQCDREILTQKSSFVASEDVEKHHKGCPLAGYHTGGSEFTSRLEYKGRIYGSISVNVPRNAVMDAEEQELFQKLARDISSALAVIEKEETGKQTEEQLRLQAQLLDAATDSVHLRELDGSFLFVNKATCDLTGYSRDELLKMNLSQIVAPEQSKLFPSRDKLLFEKGSLTFDAAIIRKDGTVIPTEIGAQLMQIGKKKCILSVSRDITERKLSEQKIKESETKYHNIFNQAPISIIIVDTEGKIIDVNPHHLKNLLHAQVRVEDYIGQNIITNQILVEAGISEEHSRILQGETISRDNISLPECDLGPAININMKGVPLYTEGRITGAVLILEDITKRMEAEKKLQESEKKFKVVFDSATDGILLTDIQSKKQFIANNTICRMLGYTPEEIQDLTLMDIHPEENHAHVLEQFDKQARGEITLIEEIPVKRKDGSIFYADISAAPITLAGKSYMLGMFRDVTERKKAEKEMIELQEQLRQSQKLEAIGSLAGGIAHDFNNLMTVISGYSQLSLNELKEGDPLMENLKEILTASNRASDLTRQLLAFSRRQVLEFKVLDLNKLIQGIEKMLCRMIGEDIELLIRPAEDLGRIKTDSGQMEQVIFNLVVNSRDAMPSGGKLILETDNAYLDEEYTHNHVSVRPGHYVRLTVSDTGYGMTTEVKNRIFDPFFTTKDKEKGTGLGLSTVYGIVKQSGGNIWVYSEHGKGTTFKIYLPMVDEPLEEIEKKEYLEAIPRGSETVLVVEDDEMVRKLAVQILKMQGYKVLEAPNSGAAFLICEQQKEPINLILTDVVMPMMNGPEFIERLRHIRQDFKTLYMSGYSNEAVVYHGVREGDMNFIQKPFSFDSLSRKVREVLDKDKKTSV